MPRSVGPMRSSSSSGGASGDDGDLEAARIRALVDELGLHEQVHFVEPQPHHILSTYYRAADVVLVPSRSESFGLVALEAAACGVPVVASAVGGLLSLVDDRRTGRLIEGRDPDDYRACDRRDPRRPRPAPCDVGRRGRAGQEVHVEFRRGAVATALQRPHGARTGVVHVIEIFDAEQLAEVERQIDGWLDTLRGEHDHILAVDRSDDGTIRWYVRMRGDDKEFTTVWLTLGQRTLRYETYVLPAPEENAAILYENLLRRNERLVGAHFSIGIEDAVFLRGEIPVSMVSLVEIDRALGTLYATVEQCFQGFLRIAFASRFAD